MQTMRMGTRCGCSTSTPSAGAVSALPAHRLLAAGPLVQFVGQVMSHLRSEVWSYTRGGDLEGTVMLDQSHLPTAVIAHRDLVRAITVYVCAHCLSPVR